ncbi:MAG TPA: fibronectin type III domain-containing protein [Terracidiphilus sp.]|jgi:hypothetical protein|nr:fibronectin type III domain-containing protein [Terracidiphilus sp.]
MKRLLLLCALTVAVDQVCLSSLPAQFTPYQAKQLPPTAKNARVRLINGPEVEIARPTWVILRWTSSNPGGADEHFAVAHYGTTPQQLDQVAKSHIRLNREHSSTVFRVRILDLKPNTTYFYTVASMGGDGKVDNLKSPESHFRTP